MTLAAIYSRLASYRQQESPGTASQTAALIELAKEIGLEVRSDWICEDHGYSGMTLERPGLERLRKLSAEGTINAVMVYAPDRLSRNRAHFASLVEEFARNAVELRFAQENAS